MDTLTKYVIYEKSVQPTNKVSMKIRYLCDDINDAENKFNILKEIVPNIFVDTLTNFQSKFLIK